jgi:predicted patatin/cPLA2 family phospholipase
MTFREQREEEKRLAAEKELKRKLSRWQDVVKELEEKKAAYEQLLKTVYTPEACRGNTSMQHKKRDIEAKLDKCYASLDYQKASRPGEAEA